MSKGSDSSLLPVGAHHATPSVTRILLVSLFHRQQLEAHVALIELCEFTFSSLFISD